MNEQTIQQQYDHITNLLTQQRLKEALDGLKGMLGQYNNYELTNRLAQIEMTYNYMLLYMKQGTADPQRNALHLKLLAQTWETTDQTRTILLDRVSSRYYHTIRRTPTLIPSGTDLKQYLQELEALSDNQTTAQLSTANQQSVQELLARHEALSRDLFLTTWTNSQWTSRDANTATLLLASQQLSASDIALFTSAVTLSLTEQFDMLKLDWLLTATEHKATIVSQRALVGLVMALYIHANRLPFYPELEMQISLLNEDGSLSRQFNRIYIQLLRSQGTEKINQKMREEIIPEMMKNARFVRNLRFDHDESAEEEDRNPDWEDTIRQSGLGDKLREMNELQQEGSDVYMSTFAHLKGNPFFRELCNWFRPFSLTQTDVARELGNKSTDDKGNTMMNLLLSSGFFCDSDKYSLCFVMAHIPQAQRDMILGQMTAHQDLSELMGDKDETGLKQYASRPEVVSNLYIHDLYRFYKLYPRRNEFYDIFAKELQLHTKPILNDILSAPTLMNEVAEFHFKKKDYTRAFEIYQYLNERDQTNAELFQKSGYCLQKGRHYAEAVESYLRADLLKPDNIWTIHHLATCYRHLNNYKEAMHYYHKAETMQPDNRNIIYYSGVCLADQKRYDEALQYFFRLDLLESDSQKTWRAIAWCYFALGKYEQAARYYDRILAARPQASDYLNAGHVAWVSKQTEQAVSFYTQAMQLCDGQEAFRKLFNYDKEELLRKGIAPGDVSLMIDAIIS